MVHLDRALNIHATSASEAGVQLTIRISELELIDCIEGMGVGLNPTYVRFHLIGSK